MGKFLIRYVMNLDNVMKFIVKFLLIMVIVSFVFWGVNDSFRAVDQDIAFKFRNHTVSRKKFAQLYQEQIAALKNNGYNEIAAMAETDPYIKSQIERKIINSLFLRFFSQEVGFVISDDMAKFEIAGMPYFQTNGLFDGEKFDATLKSMKMESAEFLESVKQELSKEQLEIIFNVTRPDLGFQAELISKASNQIRAIDVAEIVIKDIVIATNPTDDDLRSVYQSHIGDYTVGEKKAFTLLKFSFDDIVKGIDVKESDMKSYYDSNLDKFKSEKQLSLRQMIFKDSKSAAVALKEIKDGKKFDVVARQNFPKQKKFSLGPITKRGLGAEMADAIFSLNKGDVSGVISSLLGYHIFIVDDVIEPKALKYNDVRETIYNSLLYQVRHKKFSDFHADVEQALSYGISLEKVAADRKLSLKTFKIHHDKEALIYRTVLNDLGVMDVSSLQSLDDGKSYFVLRVDEVVAPVIKDFQDVRKDVALRWRDLEKKRIAQEKAEIFSRELRGGENFESLCKKHNILPVKNVLISKKNEFSKKLSKQMLRDVFIADVDGVVGYDLSSGGGSYLISQVKSIKDSGNPIISQEHKEVELLYNYDMVSDVLGHYIKNGDVYIAIR